VDLFHPFLFLVKQLNKEAITMSNFSKGSLEAKSEALLKSIYFSVLMQECKMTHLLEEVNKKIDEALDNQDQVLFEQLAKEKTEIQKLYGN
jgi:uncharacterized protein YpiB (UPF0302 family)